MKRNLPSWIGSVSKKERLSAALEFFSALLRSGSVEPGYGYGSLCLWPGPRSQLDIEAYAKPACPPARQRSCL